MPPPPSTLPPAGVGGIVVSAPASGQGKTTVTLGLLRALRRAGVDVASAKSGPDYIDPAFHAAATGRACLTLDSWAMGPERLRARAAAAGGTLLVVEGAMGLFDAAAGAPPGGPGSVMALARALGIPVILVVDAARMGQSAGALVRGFAETAGGAVAGVVLNRVGSERHAAMLRDAVAEVVPVLGMLPRRDDLVLPSRHLGLVQAAEHGDLEAFIERAADWVSAGIDLERIAGLATAVASGDAPVGLAPPGSRVAVARDRAFAFAYPHMLEDWRAAGAEIAFFSPLADQGPDAATDAVFLPGGYPELHAGRLAAAGAFRAGMAAAAARGAVIYGECGGYMVLGEGLVDGTGARHAMLGLLRLETSFAAPRRHLGYRRLTPLGGPWSGLLSGHEFHYAETLRAEGEPLFEMAAADGRPLGPAGLRAGSVSGSFAHVIEMGDPGAV